jgi:hypothetical protein
MADTVIQISLHDGTLVRHKMVGYQGTIDGTTRIKTCFTRAGVLLAIPLAKEIFQYRVEVSGEPLRQIAPAEDLEIVDQMSEIVCFNCERVFRTKPGVVDKPGGRCQCGGMICSACLACQTAESSEGTPCLKQKKRLDRKLVKEKKAKQI